MIFTFGNDWLDIIYFIVALVGTALYVFKPWKGKTREEIKNAKKIVSYGSKYGRRWYRTKSQEDFDSKYWIYGILATFFLIILPWILQELG